MSNPVVVAIHQPNFLPWLGYFDKLARSDVFVVLDNVQFPKTGGTWSNRVKLLVSGKPSWVTVPVERAFHGVREIRDIRIDDDSRWRHKLLQTLRTSYARAKAFGTVFPLVETLINTPTDSLVELNLAAIRTISDELGVDRAKLVLSSSLPACGHRTELLTSIVRAVGGTAYLAGAGSREYQDDETFAAAGISVLYQQFNHPVYLQDGTPAFVPGLSVVDALMHCGVDGARKLVQA